MYRILVIEDDFALADVIKETIESWGNEVHLVKDFSDVMKGFKEYEPHLVLVDINLPFYNGYHWCTEIRKVSNIPIMFLSSASDDMNIVMAMNMGGDDFVAKPVDAQVLNAKIQALLRRTYSMQGTVNTIEHKGVILNLGDASVMYNGETVDLTKNEYKILQTLMENKGKAVSRDTLMTKLWQMDCYVEENTLTVNVTRLRKKLGNFGLNDYIKTKVGIGYIVE
jgi:DNA-binding response OmpR family regulator